MPRISLKQLFLYALSVSVVFAVFSNASRLPAVQFWSELECSDDGKWLFAVATESSWLIDLKDNSVVAQFYVQGDKPWASQIAAFVDDDTIIAVDSQRRLRPRIVWISISEKRIVREMPITPFTHSAVSKQHFIVHNGRAFDVLRSDDGEKVCEWDVPEKSSFSFSRNGLYVSRTKPSGYSTWPIATQSNALVFDIETQSVVSKHPDSTMACVVGNDPLNPVLSGGEFSVFNGQEFPAHSRQAEYSIDGTRYDSGAVILDSISGKVLSDYRALRDGRRYVGVNSVLSADNKQIFISNTDVDKGISVYDSQTLDHLFDIRITQSRWQKIAIGFAMLIALCLLWTYFLRTMALPAKDVKSEASSIESPTNCKRMRIVWALMVVGGLIHMGLNVIAMHHIPLSSIYFVDSQFQSGAVYSAILIVGLMLIGLMIAIVVFVKGATGSTSQIKATNMFQFFIDPINAFLALAALGLQFWKPHTGEESVATEE